MDAGVFGGGRQRRTLILVMLLLFQQAHVCARRSSDPAETENDQYVKQRTIIDAKVHLAKHIERLFALHAFNNGGGANESVTGRRICAAPAAVRLLFVLVLLLLVVRGILAAAHFAQAIQRGDGHLTGTDILPGRLDERFASCHIRTGGRRAAEAVSFAGRAAVRVAAFDTVPLGGTAAAAVCFARVVRHVCVVTGQTCGVFQCLLFLENHSLLKEKYYENGAKYVYNTYTQTCRFFFV